MIEYHLGISQGYHDAAAALVDHAGNILTAAHAERFSGVKNDPKLNYSILMQMFKDHNTHCGLKNVSVNYYERNWLKNLRRLFANQKFNNTKQVEKLLLDCNIGLKNWKNWGHHQCHAAAAFQTSNFETAAVVVVDAIGEWDTTSIWKAKYNRFGKAQYKCVWRKFYPNSIGLFYTAMTKHIGLRPLEDEYVLMGLSAYGDSEQVYQQLKQQCVCSVEDLTFTHNMHAGININIDALDKDLAYATQRITSELLDAVHNKAKQLTNESNLCYSGGVALNCAYNASLTRYWKNIWIPPNPGDAGSALGAAALGYGGKLNWKTPFLGYKMKPILPESAVDELEKNGIVGVATGAAEWGPRALGNRSLLADPRLKDAKYKMNLIKQRQEYRPFAPAILSEHASDYFDLESGLNYDYMQYAVKAKSTVPDSVKHIDGTSRVQTVPPGNTALRKILELWYQRTGMPMLMNTSLNIRGKPMVNSMAHASMFRNKYGIKVIF